MLVSIELLMTLWWYFRNHRGFALCTGLVLGGFALIYAMQSRRGFSSWDGVATTPLAVAVVAGLSAFAVSTWSTVGGHHEDSLITRSTISLRLFHPLTATVTVLITIVWTSLAIGSSLDQTLRLSRAAFCFCVLGFALAFLFGSNASWIGPILFWLAINSFGYGSHGLPRWWNVAMTPIDDASSWALTLSLAMISSVLLRNATR